MADTMPQINNWSDLQSLLASMGPSEEDKRRARALGLLGFGLTFAGAQKGMELPALGKAGLLGVGLSNQQLRDLSEERVHNIAAATGALNVQELMRRRADEDAARQAAIQFYGQNGAPGVPSPAPVASTIDMGPPSPQGQYSPQPVAPSILPASPAASTGPVPTLAKQSKFEQYSALAQMYASKGLIDAAQKASDLAEKYRPKVKEIVNEKDPVTGQLVRAAYYDDGTRQVVSGAAPYPEKAHFSSTGQMVDIPRDPFTGVPIGTGLQAQMDPAQVASNKIAQANLALSQAANARAAAAETKPIWDAAAGQFVYPPTAKGGARAESVPGFIPPEKAQNETQTRYSVFAPQMAEANKTMAELESKGFGQSFGSQHEIEMAAPGGMGKIGAIPMVGAIATAAKRAIAGPEAQKYQQAAQQWAQSYRSVQSARGVSPDVIEGMLRTFIPQVGDTPDVVKQRAKARAEATAAINAAVRGGNQIKLEDPLGIR